MIDDDDNDDNDDCRKCIVENRKDYIKSNLMCINIVIKGFRPHDNITIKEYI